MSITIKFPQERSFGISDVPEGMAVWDCRMKPAAFWFPDKTRGGWLVMKDDGVTRSASEEYHANGVLVRIQITGVAVGKEAASS